MSSYRSFYPCVMCRTRRIRKEYAGEYEVTMLLNSLFFSSIMFLEMDDKAKKKHDEKAHILFPKASRWLKEHKDSVFQNSSEGLSKAFEADPENVLIHIRHALAHFNVGTEKENDKISEIRLTSKPDNDKTTNCEFVFAVEDLREFVSELEDDVIKVLPKLVKDSRENENPFTCVGCELCGELGVKEWEH